MSACDDAGMTTYQYICDACGALVTITNTPIPEGEAWQCDCGCSALWEFTNADKALAHAAHIRLGLASGLFGKRRRT